MLLKASICGEFGAKRRAYPASYNKISLSGNLRCASLCIWLTALDTLPLGLYETPSLCFVLADIRYPADGLLNTLNSVQHVLSSLGLPLPT